MSVSVKLPSGAHSYLHLLQNRYNNQDPGPETQSVVVEDDEELYEDEEEERISVPLTITMLVIGGYVILGALLFAAWEKWSLLEVCREK